MTQGLVRVALLNTFVAKISVETQKAPGALMVPNTDIIHKKECVRISRRTTVDSQM